MPRTRRVSDTSLVRRSQQGDRRAFRALLSRYDWRLRGLAHALLLDPVRVDDVLRIAYLRAWREVVRIDPKGDASAWLYRVVYNACIDGLRRESARTGTAPPNGAAATGPYPAAAAPGAPSDSGDTVEGHAPAHDGDTATTGSSPTQMRLIEALTNLAPSDRVAVVLVDREGFTPPAAARILGLTDEVLEARLAGARARLVRQAGLKISPPPSSSPPAAAVGGERDSTSVDHDGSDGADEPVDAETPSDAGAGDPEGSDVTQVVAPPHSTNGAASGNGAEPAGGAP